MSTQDKIKQLPNGERIDPMKVFEQMPERQQNLVLAKAWIMQNDHFLFPLDGESEIDHHARILMVFAAQWRADLTAENERLKTAIKSVLPHFESHQVYDKGSEAILRSALTPQENKDGD